MLIKESLIRRKLRSFALRIFNKLDNNNNSDFACNGEAMFASGVLEYFAASSKGKVEDVVVFDLGANVGNYSELLLSYNSKNERKLQIHIFEPTKGCYEILTRKFANDTQVVLNNMAVSDKEGSSEIFYDKEKSTLASMYQRDLSAYSMKLSERETIHTDRLDVYIREHGIKHIDLMKFDIEGHELPACRGMGEYLNGDFVDFIQFEYGGANLDSHTSLLELYAMFDARGFAIAKIMPKGLEIRKYRSWMENFTYANYVAISRRVIGKLS
jgi:FkbM family methyltransferase